jgi:GTP-binding protein EngB required for normal cell division
MKLFVLLAKKHLTKFRLVDSMSKKLVVTESVYEYQKRPFMSVYNSFDVPSEWYDEKKQSKMKESFELPEGWKWISEWKNGGSDSWEYASDWSNNAKDWGNVPGIFYYARRRLWQRPRIKLCTDDEVKELTAKKIHFKEYNDTNSVLNTLRGDFSKKYKDELETVTTKTMRPNILLLGGSGAGKSTLVNAVFGSHLAQIGEGKPVTQTYTKYSSETSPVTIYDSRGIEHGYAQKGFTEDTEQFFQKLTEQPELEAHIHVVWYVLDLTQARFQPFEAEFCRTFLAKYPIIFVLNKADSVSQEVRDTMIKCIQDHNLLNIRGIFATIANCKNFDAKSCEKCKSTKIKKRIQGDSCTVMCKECNAKYVLGKTAGIKELAAQTAHVMPNLVKSVFVNNSQQEILKLSPKAKEIIAQFADYASLKPTIRKDLSEMLSKLLKLYDMQFIQKEVDSIVIEQYVRFHEEIDFGRRTLMSLSEIFKKNSIATSLFIAAGLEVCRAIIHFKFECIKYAVLDNEEFDIKKDEKEISDSLSNSIAILMNPPKIDKDLLLETLYENLDIMVDSNVISKIDTLLSTFQGSTKFLKDIDLSLGTRPFGDARERKSSRKSAKGKKK